MSLSGIGDLQLNMEKKEAVIDTRQKSKIKTEEEKTNGYNEIKTFEENPNDYLNKPSDNLFELKGKSVKCKGTAFDDNFRIIAERERNPFDTVRKRNIKGFEKEKISKNTSEDVSDLIKKHISSNHQALDDKAEDNLTSVRSDIKNMGEIFGSELPMPQKNEFGDVTLKSKEDCRKVIDRDCKNIDKSYEKLINSIDICLKNDHGEVDNNDELKKALKDLKKQCEIEKEAFKDKIYQYADDMINNPRRKAHATWGDALEYARESNKGMDKIEYKMVQNFDLAYEDELSRSKDKVVKAVNKK